MEQLKKRGYQMPIKCPLCKKVEEDLDHLFIHCLVVWGMWAALLSIPGFQWVCPYSLKEVMSRWSCFPIKKKAKKVWMAAPLSLIWAIWRERNRIVFEDEVFSPNRMKLSFVSALISWAGLILNVECSLARILLCIL